MIHHFFIAMRAFKRVANGVRVPRVGENVEFEHDGHKFFAKGWPTCIAVTTTVEPAEYFEHIRGELWGVDRE